VRGGASARDERADASTGREVVVHSLDVEPVVPIAALKPGAREQALDLLQRSTKGSEQERVMQRLGIHITDTEAYHGGIE
jgi:hypothetical protein